MSFWLDFTESLDKFEENWHLCFINFFTPLNLKSLPLLRSSLNIFQWGFIIFSKQVLQSLFRCIPRKLTFFVVVDILIASLQNSLFLLLLVCRHAIYFWVLILYPDGLWNAPVISNTQSAESFGLFWQSHCLWTVRFGSLISTPLICFSCSTALAAAYRTTLSMGGDGGRLCLFPDSETTVSNVFSFTVSFVKFSLFLKVLAGIKAYQMDFLQLSKKYMFQNLLMWVITLMDFLIEPPFIHSQG